MKWDAHVYIGASNEYERKEEFIEKMMVCITRLNPTESAQLAKMLGGAKPDYRDVYIPSGTAAKDAIRMEPSDRNLERRRARAIKRLLFYCSSG